LRYLDSSSGSGYKRHHRSGGFGSISICLVRFPFVRIDFHLFGSISICSDRFPFVWFDFHLFGSISICSVRFRFVRYDFHLFGTISIYFHYNNIICSDDFHDDAFRRGRSAPLPIRSYTLAGPCSQGLLIPFLIVVVLLLFSGFNARFRYISKSRC
jgi:hypothetical protein